jgi:hypothetical protein
MTEETNEVQLTEAAQPRIRRGKKPMLNPEIIEEICTAVSIGTPNKYAAIYAGVSEEAYYKWFNIGQDEIRRLENDTQAKPDRKKAIYVQFVKSLAEARANRVVTWVNTVNDAAVSDPKLALEMLARTEPDDFSPQSIMTHRVEKELEKALDLLEQGLNADEYAKVVRLLAGEVGGPALAEDTAEPGE